MSPPTLFFFKIILFNVYSYLVYLLAWLGLILLVAVFYLCDLFVPVFPPFLCYKQITCLTLFGIAQILFSIPF